MIKRNAEPILRRTNHQLKCCYSFLTNLMNYRKAIQDCLYADYSLPPEAIAYLDDDSTPAVENMSKYILPNYMDTITPHHLMEASFENLNKIGQVHFYFNQGNHDLFFFQPEWKDHWALEVNMKSKTLHLLLNSKLTEKFCARKINSLDFRGKNCPLHIPGRKRPFIRLKGLSIAEQQAIMELLTCHQVKCVLDARTSRTANPSQNSLHSFVTTITFTGDRYPTILQQDGKWVRFFRAEIG